MKKIIKPLIIASSLLAIGAANAKEDSRYFVVGLSNVDAKVDHLGTFSSTMINFKDRQDFHKNLAVEATFAAGVSDANKKFAGKINGSVYDAKATIKPIITAGFFGVGKLPINEHLEIYGKLGAQYMNVKIKAKVTEDGDSFDYSDSKSKIKPVYGAGANFFINKIQGVNLEVTGFEFNKYADVTTVSLSYVHKF